MVDRLGDYELIEPLGRGAMGAVFRARDLQLGREVAIKQLIATTPRTLTRFAREAAAIARLQHPAIVKLHEAKLDDPRPHLVMSYVEGEALETRLEREGPLPAERVQQIGVVLAEALAHAHAHGVLHRDLKPGNVLLGADGRVYLSDFGLAKDMTSEDPLTRTGQIVGTPAFMAPEQARGDRAAIGPGTDVYGLGATLYTALTGQPPYGQDNFMALMVALDKAPPTPLRRVVPGIDPCLASIVMRCLAKRPQDRFESAAALAAALAAPESYSPPGAHERRVAAGSAAVVLLALGALGTWAATRPAQVTPSESETAELPAPAASRAPANEAAWRAALETARRHLRRGGLARAKAANAALGDLKGLAPDVPERGKLQAMIGDALIRLLPRRTGRAFERSKTEELVEVLKLAVRLPARPPVEANLWERTWRAATRFRLDRSGFGAFDDDLQGLVADLDPTNVELQERVLSNSDLLGSKARFLPAARRLVAHPYRDPARRLVAHVRLAQILGNLGSWSRPLQIETLEVTELALKLITQARRDRLSEPKRMSLPTTPGRDWLETCTGLVHLARGRSLVGLRRFEGALNVLAIASRNIQSSEIPALRIVSLEQTGRTAAALKEGHRYLADAGVFSLNHDRVVQVLWCIYRAHGRGLAELRRHMGQLLEHRPRTKPSRWVCLAWLDQQASDTKARSRSVKMALRQLDEALNDDRWGPETRQALTDLRPKLQGLLPRLELNEPAAATELAELAKRAGEDW